MSADPSSARDQSARRRVYVATANLGKVHELLPLFAGHGFVIERSAGYVSPAEGDYSYSENAALKARTLHRALCSAGGRANVLADDSGLEVRALGGRPGVTTADYGGAGATWAERRTLLLRELAGNGSGDRRARFVCAMHYIDADGREFGAFATVDGEIAAGERGTLGFSFDPIFWYSPARRTFAELTDAEKNRVSHRAIAAAGIIAAIEVAETGLPSDCR